MATRVIQEILKNGTAINDNLGKKIGLLNERNSKFNNDLLKKLNEIISAISAFKNTNLQGLTDTKNKLTEVSKELETTKTTLNQNQQQLQTVQANLSAAQNELQTANARKNELEQKDRELNDKLAQLETNYNNKISGIRDEMSKTSTAEKNAMQQEFNNQITTINNEKAQLQQAVENAKLAQTEAVNNLTALQKDQENLIVSLGNINSFLTKQLELIDSINVNSPNIEEYTSLLDTIQTGLGGVISNINQAVSAPVNSDTLVYDKFISLTPDQQESILQTLSFNDKTYIEDNMNTTDIVVKRNIRNMLKRYTGDLLKGGKRKRKQKTMKRRSKRTKKLMKNRKLMKNLKGGYVYSSSKDLDKASSIISASSNSNSNSNSKSKSNKKAHKTKRRSSKQ
jgi:predicted nuclease with TOPRIM domain